MGRVGFIREELDIKILILFVLRRLSGPVDSATLCGLCQWDSAIDYFDYTDCLSDLVTSGHVEQTVDGYRITDKGAKNADAVESSLPYSVRSKTLRLIVPVDERLRRLAMIKTEHELREDGCHVSLSMSDGKGELISLSLLCGGEEQAGRIEKNFKADAEGFYQRIIEILDEEIK